MKLLDKDTSSKHIALPYKQTILEVEEHGLVSHLLGFLDINSVIYLTSINKTQSAR